MVEHSFIGQSPFQTPSCSSICPLPPASQPPGRAVHPPGHTTHRLACYHPPSPRISLHTSHSQKPEWSHALTGALSALVLLDTRSSEEAESTTFLLYTSPLGNIHAHQLAGLTVLACLNHLCCWVQAPPLAGLSNQWVWAQSLGECPLFSCSLSLSLSISCVSLLPLLLTLLWCPCSSCNVSISK